MFLFLCLVRAGRGAAPCFAQALVALRLSRNRLARVSGKLENRL